VIPVHRAQLPPKLDDLLRRRTLRLGASPHPVAARTSWKSSNAVRQRLKEQLERTAFRPAFCMYCQESRGTDIDHYRPIVLAPHLAFVWTNHLLACGYCNQQAKRDDFPMTASGEPLLLDPTVDDSGLHLTMSHAGHLIPLTDRGEATVQVLRLNTRPEITVGREKALRHIERVLRRARDLRTGLTSDEVEDFRHLSLLDALHFFTHAVARGDLFKFPQTKDLADYAADQLATLSQLFPQCTL